MFSTASEYLNTLKQQLADETGVNKRKMRTLVSKTRIICGVESLNNNKQPKQNKEIEVKLDSTLTLKKQKDGEEGHFLSDGERSQFAVEI